MSSQRLPGLWHGVAWALKPGARGGSVSRTRLLWRTLSATLGHAKAMRRWMAMACELHDRGIIADLPGEYLRAVRPSVHRGTDYTTRVIQLIDHHDWIETAFQRSAYDQVVAGRPVVVAELPAPRGYEYMRLQLQRTPPNSPEGELVLSLTLQRTPDVQRKPQPVEAAALGFSRFRIDGLGCLVIGGVRGQRSPVMRVSPVEIGQALCGWKPAVLMVRVAQELARHWNLHLVGLDPSSHRLQSWTYQWSKRHREAALRIYNSYDALWEHFEAKKGPPGWMVLPLNSDEKLEATALSPEKRARQTRRADYWIRVRNLLRVQFRKQLQRPTRDLKLGHATESLGPKTESGDDDLLDDAGDFESSADDLVPSRAYETGPATLL